MQAHVSPCAGSAQAIAPRLVPEPRRRRYLLHIGPRIERLHDLTVPPCVHRSCQDGQILDTAFPEVLDRSIVRKVTFFS